ncbi:MAG TPA: signal recognition particle protein [bacterium]|nr:signal recognition particle protein [bacterium]HPN43136.1 signal recognition particle protein [bacterium]
MFQELTEKFDAVIRTLKGYGKLSDKNIADSMREIRRVLLEADVNYLVAKNFIADVQQRAIGQEVLKSITPGQLVVKIIHDELKKLMGDKDSRLNFSNRIPGAIMLTGLQGSGKTTFAGKLALHLRKKGRNPLLVAADIYRPAAIEQLKVVGKSINIATYSEESQDPVTICKNAVQYARQNMKDTIILDTAGRLHIDDELMHELENIKAVVNPDEILFVADGMTGQDAVNTAKAFVERLDFTGIVLTKMDGDARGGAALSIRAVTHKPIKFLSVGEKLDQLEIFYPDRMASRILGMGDVVSFVEKAQESFDAEKAARLEQKIFHQDFTLADFLEQLQQIKKMGPLQDLLAMIPGMQNRAMKGIQVDDNALIRVEAIINSMTLKERRLPNVMNASRRKRVAQGSGTSVQDVNKVLNQFEMMRKMMKMMKKGGKMKLGIPGMPSGF